MIILCAGCGAEKHPEAEPKLATGYPVAVKGVYPVKVNGIFRVTFPNGSTALVMNYETNIPIEKMQALEVEVAGVWQIFQNQAEEAGISSAVIRAAHYEGTGAVREGNGYGFLFERDSAGQWQRMTKQ